MNVPSFFFCEFVVTTTKWLRKLVLKKTTATYFSTFFPSNFKACHVKGMRTKVQKIDVVAVAVAAVGPKDLSYWYTRDICRES